MQWRKIVSSFPAAAISFGALWVFVVTIWAACVVVQADELRPTHEINGLVMRGDLETLATGRPMQVQAWADGELVATALVQNGAYSIRAPRARGLHLKLVGEDLRSESTGNDFVVYYSIYAEAKQ